MLNVINTLRMWIATRTDGERGATAVEYGLLVALIAVAIIGAVVFLGTDLSNLFTSVGGHVTSKS